jgi:membrane protease YdiL (CAAX protease family)
MAAILQPLNTRSQPAPAPPVVAVLLGALPTFIVLVGLLVFGSIWAAVFGVETSWVLAPAVVCWVWPASRKGAADDWHAATQRLRLQALVGVAFWMVSAASAVLGFWLLGRHTGIIPMVRSRAAEFGLSEGHSGAVWFFIFWFSLVNPVLEEFFWRIFIFGHLLPPQPRRRTERRPEEQREEDREEQEARRPAAAQASTPLGGVSERVGETTPINGSEGGRRGWPAWWGWPAAAAASSALYAAYHLSVLLLFLPLPYAILGEPPPYHPPALMVRPLLPPSWPSSEVATLCAGELFVFGYGYFLQHLTRKLGVVTSILTHAGGDAVVAFVLADCIWNFLPPLR